MSSSRLAAQFHSSRNARIASFATVPAVPAASLGTAAAILSCMSSTSPGVMPPARGRATAQVPGDETALDLDAASREALVLGEIGVERLAQRGAAGGRRLGSLPWRISTSSRGGVPRLATFISLTLATVTRLVLPPGRSRCTTNFRRGHARTETPKPGSSSSQYGTCLPLGCGRAAACRRRAA